MEILEQILDNLNNIWNKSPKDVPVIYIERGEGTHIKATVTTTKLCFHTDPYNKDMPLSQTVYLDGYTIGELVDIINSMGYRASLTSEAIQKGLGTVKAYTLMEIKNMSINPSVTLSAFTSTVWQTLYPIARQIDDWINNMDDAIAEVFATICGDRWLEYWASFFKLKRALFEKDEALRKRMFMSLANIRTNNIALAEIVGMLIKSKVSVNDAAPAIIEVVVDPSFMGKFDDIKNAVIKNKAGGVAFTINYSGRSPDEEFYRDYFESQYETPFKDSDIAFLSSMIAMLSEVYKGRVLDSIQGTNIEYGCLENYQRLHYVGEPFIVGGSLLCGEDVLVSPEYASNSCYMEMTLNGEAIKSGVLI